jgi:hypothetical protein
VVNFDEVAISLTGLHRKAASDGEDPERDALLAELTALPGIPEAGVVPDLSRPPNPVLPLHLKRDDFELRLFTAVTQIACPRRDARRAAHRELHAGRPGERSRDSPARGGSLVAALPRA